jgi:hypothetical protein
VEHMLAGSAGDAIFTGGRAGCPAGSLPARLHASLYLVISFHFIRNSCSNGPPEIVRVCLGARILERKCAIRGIEEEISLLPTQFFSFRSNSTPIHFYQKNPNSNQGTYSLRKP